jgi:hypothetical protein
VDITFSAIRSIRTSSTHFSAALSSSDIHAQDQITQIDEWVLKAIEQVSISVNTVW